MTWLAVSASLVATWCTTSCSWSPSLCGWSLSLGGSSGETLFSINRFQLKISSCFRHRVGPDALYSLVGEEQLNNFRASLGDKDEIHVVQFTDPDRQDYCDRTLYMVAFVILTAGWLVDVLHINYLPWPWLTLLTSNEPLTDDTDWKMLSCVITGFQVHPVVRARCVCHGQDLVQVPLLPSLPPLRKPPLWQQELFVEALRGERPRRRGTAPASQFWQRRLAERREPANLDIGAWLEGDPACLVPCPLELRSSSLSLRTHFFKCFYRSQDIVNRAR